MSPLRPSVCVREKNTHSGKCGETSELGSFLGSLLAFLFLLLLLLHSTCARERETHRAIERERERERERESVRSVRREKVRDLTWFSVAWEKS